MKPSWWWRAAPGAESWKQAPGAARGGARNAHPGYGLSAATCALGLLSLVACGYRSHASSVSAERLCVLAAPAKVPDFEAIQSALDGAREELARHAALGGSGVYPCLVIEVLRVDEAPAGVVSAPLEGAAQVRARGTGVALVARAWIRQGPETPISRDTGNVRRVARLEATTGPLEGARHDRGLGLAGRQLGRDLVRRVLGLPTPSDELP